MLRRCQQAHELHLKHPPFPSATRSELQEEVDRQAPVIDAADKGMGAVAATIKSNNTRLRGVVAQARWAWSGVVFWHGR